jgi:predicted DNA-binding transcriptional regulator AlpA
MSDDRLLEPKDVAEMLRMTDAWVEDVSRRGVLPGFKPAGGRYWRYRRETILAWIEEQEQAGQAPRPRRKPSIPPEKDL